VLTEQGGGFEPLLVADLDGMRAGGVHDHSSGKHLRVSEHAIHRIHRAAWHSSALESGDPLLGGPLQESALQWAASACR
jgi:hypothetical protein